MSSFEQKIYKILCQENLSFVQEKTFDDLARGRYRFDFYIPSLNICLEINGLQHYQYTKMFHKKRSDFTKAQERDRKKISYCLAHNIHLYCIPFWEIDHLSTFQDIISEKFFVKSKFHNDLAWREHQKNR